MRTDLLSIPLGFLFLLMISACDAGPGAEQDDPALNQELEAVITKDGQRRLDNFRLPASDDFASIPQDPNNPITASKVELGKLLFHEPAISRQALHPSGVGTYSCATCHHAAAGFNAGRRQSIADGGRGWGKKGEARGPASDYAVSEIDAPPLRSPTILNVAYQRVMLWSGAAGANGPNRETAALWDDVGDTRLNYLGYDGVETQAILAIKKHRLSNISESLVATHPTYRTLWDQAFPGQVVTDELAGLAMAAYERTVLANRSPFQRWLKGETGAMTSAQKRGAIVFFGPSACADCHTGPALNSMAFYALGMLDMEGSGVLLPAGDLKGRGSFVPAEDYTFKVPQLYNLTDAGFLGHGGSFSTVNEVVDYYVIGVPDRVLPSGTITSQFHPLTLTQSEVNDLITFLKEALRDPDLKRYQPKSVPSGGCIPANDPEARKDLGC